MKTLLNDFGRVLMIATHRIARDMDHTPFL
jgi:hypothetical protein